LSTVREGARQTAKMRSEEIELINLVLLGISGAADRFVEQYGRFVFKVTREFVQDRFDVDEIFQRVFVRIWAKDFRALRSWSGDGSFLSYLRVIVQNSAVDYLSERGTRSVDVPAPNFDDDSVDQERRRILREAIDGLSPREREIIRRRHYDGESYAEIALGLGITVNHVGVLLYTAENRLREIVSHQDPELFPQGHV